MTEEQIIHVFVVDDEPIGADDISDIIYEQFHETRHVEVHTAYNAATVLKQTETIPCDILLSDIKMPGMTGLELAARMRERFPKISIIFLTGFDDFSYAYEAYRQNAFQYLLKTEGDEVILDAVEKCIDIIGERRRLIERIVDAEARYDRILPDYRKQLLTQALQAGESEQIEESPFVPGFLNLLMARFEKDDVPDTQKLVVMSAVQDILVEGTSRILWSEHFLMGEGPVWMIATETEDVDVGGMFHLVRNVRKRIEDQLGLQLFFVISQKPVPYPEVGMLYRKLQGMLMHEIMEGETGAAIQRNDLPGLHPDDERWKLGHCLEMCRKDLEMEDAYRFRMHIRPLLEYMETHPEDLLSEEIRSLLDGYVYHYVNSNDLGQELLALRNACPVKNLAYYEKIADLIAGRREKEKGNAVKSIADFISRYVDDHISEDVSMQALSDASGYSTGYLARVFKQQEGVSIHDYITDKRIGLAKAMLMGSNMRVYEIASRCGYDNTAYFIRVFKIQTGLTPQEYKDSMHH